MYKRLMIFRLAGQIVSGLIVAAILGSGVAVHGQPDQPIPDPPLTVTAKREIIKLLLNDIFRGKQKETIYLSTKNIPAEIQDDFPTFEKLTARLVSPEAGTTADCPFEFSVFAVSGEKAAVLFGDCRDGLGYNFEEIGGKWQFAPLDIKRKLVTLAATSTKIDFRSDPGSNHKQD